MTIPRTFPRPAALACLAAPTLAAWAGVLALGPIGGSPGGFVALYGGAFLVYGAAVLLVLRRGGGSRLSLAIVLATGLAARLILLPAPPSDDVNRYLFEAEVQRAGFNPYSLAPDDPALADVRAASPWYAGVNHKGWSAIYPPVTMLWHRAFGFGPVSLKVSFLFAEAAAVWLLLGLLTARGLDPDRVVVYAWNPLVLWSIAHQGHNDAVAIALLLLALVLAVRPARGWAAAAAATGSVLAKFLTAPALPAFLGRVRLRWWLLAAPLALLLYLPFLDAGAGLFRSLVRFGGELHSGDSIHAVLAAAVRGVGGKAVISRILAAGVWVGVLVYVLRRVPPDPVRRAAWLLGALLLVLPTAHSW